MAVQLSRRAHVLVLLVCAALSRPAQADLELKSDMTSLPTVSGSATPCRFRGSDYNVGSTWHPKLEDKGGKVFCVTCKCIQGPNPINCTSLVCPVECNNPENQDCCEVCEARSKKNSNRTTNSRSDEVACVSGGQQYREGQKVVSNRTVLRPEVSNQCVLCLCKEGVVECNVINCTRPACSQPIVGSDSCCPICPPTEVPSGVSAPDSDHKVQLPVWMMEVGQKNKRGKSCVLENKQYMEGEMWHPIMGPFGPMYCVNCQCKSGRIECSRWCPDPSTLSCSKPMRLPGQCCASCPPQVVTMSEAAPQQQKTYAAKSIRQLNQCLPLGKSILVYNSSEQSFKGEKTVEMIQFAFSNKSLKGVELHTWQLQEGIISSFKTRNILNQDFQHMAIQYQLSTLGATTYKNLERFRMRERKVFRRCKANCGAKIMRTLQILQTTAVELRPTCLPDEIKI